MSGLPTRCQECGKVIRPNRLMLCRECEMAEDEWSR